jgi:hypothetical protein
MTHRAIWRALCALLLLGLTAAKLVREEITLTWDLGAPNGETREMIKMNDGFPGPYFVWDEDDEIEVNRCMLCSFAPSNTFKL